MTIEVWVAFWIGGVVKYLLSVAEEYFDGTWVPGFSDQPTWQQLVVTMVVAALWPIFFPVTTAVALVKATRR